MELKDFIGKFVSQFEEEDPTIFEADLDFHELDTYLRFILPFSNSTSSLVNQYSFSRKE